LDRIGSLVHVLGGRFSVVGVELGILGWKEVDAVTLVKVLALEKMKRQKLKSRRR
jgi:hypothetical protein